MRFFGSQLSSGGLCEISSFVLCGEHALLDVIDEYFSVNTLFVLVFPS